jgi:hypothetical protein
MIIKNKKLLFVSILILVIGFIIYDSTSQPNVGDLKGNFKEVAVYRNENNTGPIVRIYAVTVDGSPWDEMKKYGDLMPYTKYGSTTVYFFGSGEPVPDQLSATEPHFGETFKANCLGIYSKDQNGEVSFRQQPFNAN